MSQMIILRMMIARMTNFEFGCFARFLARPRRAQAVEQAAHLGTEDVGS